MLNRLLKQMIIALGFILSLVVGFSVVQEYNFFVSAVIAIAAGAYIGAGIGSFIDRINELEQ
jgi:hypothetical protein